MKYILISFIVLTIFLVLVYYILNNISEKIKLDINIEKEMLKQINKLKLKTKIKVLDKVKPNYNLVSDEIEINEGNNLKILSEALHELGHAFYNHFEKHKVYNSNKELIEYEYKEIKLNLTFSNLLGFLFTKSIILSLIITLFGVFLEMKTLMFLGILFSLISFVLHIINLIEEIISTKIAKEIIIYEKYLNKNEKTISFLYLNSALFTYLFITLFSLTLLIINLIYIFK